MKDIEYYNRKYNSLESLLTSKGDLNTAVIRREWFPLTEIYLKILGDTKYLDVFENMTFADRFTILHSKLDLEYCKTCGRPHIHVSKSNHSYRLCSHKFNMNVSKLSKSQIAVVADKKDRFLKSLENKDMVLNQCDFDRMLGEFYAKPNNCNFALTEDNAGFFHDVMLKTSGIIGLDGLDFRFSERIYILTNGLKEVPKCLYCGNKVHFNNRKTGYSRTCRIHSHMLNVESRVSKNREEIDSAFNFEKYDIMKYPEMLTRDCLEIRCKKCGMVSEWRFVNGRIKGLENMQLCRNCEGSNSKKEESLYEMISSVYGGEIVHHNGSRKIIPPYELDIYIPEKKIAIEFDGIHWHGELSGGKDSSYHLKKTEMCERNGIQLVHVFESEYVKKYDIVKSRLKNLLGVYDSTIYARKCRLGTVDSKTACKFMEENHLQGYVKSKVNIGLFYEGELVSMMTFRKPRMTRKYEWELMRFCNKLGCHVVGGASKLLRHFEKTLRPKSIISYADRRWSTGKLYKAIGFSFMYNSRPNYWYFKTNNIYKLMNRMNFQKFRQKDMLENFNEGLTEVENMRNNGYDRIFDCGNMVFVKEYENS